ncbi:hypothetical protein DRP77_01155 [Candidatus Poribacteria bacterium]|nr:MAG: hypothetical protein DRP77_01155 [Candidatus Poribacteria bacterium]
MKMTYPKKLHDIYKFEIDDRLFVADLDRCEVLEIDKLVWDILDICDSLDAEQIIETLGDRYTEDEIMEALQSLEKMEEYGLIFGESPSHAEERGGRMKILAPRSRVFEKEMRWTALGGIIAHTNLLKSMTKYADVYVTREIDLIEGAHLIPLDLRQRASKAKAISMGFDGVFLWFPTELEFLDMVSYMDSPLIMPIHEERGENGIMINLVMIWYSLLRDFDSFVIFSESTREFYSKFLMDPSFFKLIPLGVDAEQFRPMDKQAAKRKVAEMTGRAEILERKVVGFLARFQPEKGAGIYIKLAEMNPEYLFLVVAPSLGFYSNCHLPSNLIYAGRQPREKLPLFYNAFDLFCFPSLLAETFGMVVLEAMACGVPPIVPDFHGARYVVGDAGIIVEGKSFQHDIGSLSGYIPVELLSEAINRLMKDDHEMERLSRKARERALKFSWDASAKELIRLFKELNLRKRFIKRRRLFHVTFSPVYEGKSSGVKSTILNLTQYWETPLQRSGYTQSVEEGIALTLLKRHSMREVESVLSYICRDRRKASEVLSRVNAILESVI